MAHQNEQNNVSDDEDDIDVNGDKQKSSVMLGVLSGPLSDEYINDVSVSRAGGPPVWCNDSLKQTAIQCRVCSAKLYLVAQIYAPFGGSRALHIFGCNNVYCSKNKGSLILMHVCAPYYLLVARKTNSKLTRYLRGHRIVALS